MRRRIGVVALLVVILGGVGIGVGAYRTGERNGIAEGIEHVRVAQENGQNVQVVHLVGDGRGGFFPGFFLFPLFLFGTFFLVGGVFKGAGRFRGQGVHGPGGHGPGGHGPGPWNEEGRRRFEERAREWHRNEHGDVPPAEAQPAG